MTIVTALNMLRMCITFKMSIDRAPSLFLGVGRLGRWRRSRRE